MFKLFFKNSVFIGLVLISLNTCLNAEETKKHTPENLVQIYKLNIIMGKYAKAIDIINLLHKDHQYFSSETYYDLCQSYKSLFDESEKDKDKIHYLEKIYGYSDSLSFFCGNEKIEKKYKKDCKKYITVVDSLKKDCRNQIYGDK